jgi:hypothetical protein
MQRDAACIPSVRRISLWSISKRDLREISVEYQAVWLLRNRPGGLTDSVARLERSQRDYAG